MSNRQHYAPDDAGEGLTGKERNMLEKHQRGFQRLQQAHKNQAPSAPSVPPIPGNKKNTYVVPTSKHMQQTKIVIPLALRGFDTSNIDRNAQNSVQQLQKAFRKEETLSPDGLPKSFKRGLDDQLGKLSPSERIGSLYSPSAVGLSPSKLKLLKTSLLNTTTEPVEEEINSARSEESDTDIPTPIQTDSKAFSILLSREFNEEEKRMILSDGEIESRKSKFYPLEVFDDEETETHTPEQWVELGKNQGGTRAQSKYFNGKELVWEPCRVIDYNEDTSTFTIKFEIDGKEKQVKRLNLIFDQEDEILLKRRIKCAMVRRMQAERDTRYQLQVDMIPNEEVSTISDEQVDRVLELVASEFPVQHLHIIEECVASMKENYRQSIKLSIFEYHMNNPAERERFESLDLPPPRQRQPAPEVGVLPVPEYDFIGTRNYIEENIFYKHKILIETLMTVHEQIKVLGDHNMLDVALKGIPKPCDLQVFVDLQKETLTGTIRRLKDDWSQKATSIIQNELDDFFNFYEDDAEKFENSRMKRFLRLINLIMAFQLRDLTENELTKFTKFVQEYQVLSGSGFNPLEVNGQQPLFGIKIVFDGTHCAYEPSLESIMTSMKSIYDKVVEETQAINAVGDKLFPLLNIFEKGNRLSGLRKDDKMVHENWKTIAAVIKSNFDAPVALLALYEKYSIWMKLDLNSYLEKFKEQVANFQFDSIRQELKNLYKAASDIENLSLNTVNVELFAIDCSHIKQVLSERTKGIANSLLEFLSEKGKEDSHTISVAFQEIFAKIQIVPTNAEELDALKKYLVECTSEIEKLQEKFEKVRENFGMINEFNYTVEESHFSTYVDTYSWPKKVFRVLQDSSVRLEEDKRKFMDELQETLSKLVSDIDSYAQELDEFTKFDNLEKVDVYYQRVEDMTKKINEAKAKAELYNNRERMFNWNTTEFSQLQELSKTFEPYAELWTTAFQESQAYPEWHDGPFNSLNPTLVEDNTTRWFNSVKKLEKTLAQEGPKNVCVKLKEKLSEFKKRIPLIKALRNDGLRDRHWKKISALIGRQLNLNTDQMKLSDLMKMKLEKYLNEIQEISDYASKEYAISVNRDKMESEWKQITFHLEAYGTTWKLVELEEIQTLLDEQIMLTQSMRASPYVKEVEMEVIAWEKKLLERQDILSEWVTTQVGYLYLEPVFTSQDIATQLPDEATKFGMVDKMWRNIMDITNKTRIVTQVTSIENIKSNFVLSNQMLEAIHKSLKDYLETKRRSFPRFYFLTDEELLEILSETKNPRLVQNHLKKCFEGIEKLEFTDGEYPDLGITAMLSKEGERIGFTKTIKPADFSGKVELWLLEVEKEMRESIRVVIEQSITAYAVTDRVKWILKYPGQVILAVSQLYWTKEVEESIRVQGVKGLQKYLTKMQKQMNDLINMVRMDITELQRISLGALVVIEVHAKDVVANLVKEEVADVSNFEWQNQLRYYWENKDMIVKQVTAVLNYGYEYLGNSFRLVITPLTDRCYRTLMGALQLYRGGAPEGPAGTGKTETTKDLAKAIAKQCVVFNCSDSLTNDAMAKFFKGLASSGAWSCFDEFNRIELEVLSVIAQQIQTIQSAVQALIKDKGKTTFMFEGTEIGIKAGCAIFITMNPGYAGRSELPDNLKALFRPVAMMVPDYALIAEISLFSYGFLNGRNLARKIVATYRLCSEQLSSQDHYDYGMRAVKAVLVAAGALKRQFPNENEDRLMLRALLDVNLPKFLSQDIPLFKGIIGDLFPGIEKPTPDYTEMNKCLVEACANFNLQPVDVFMDKCIQLYEMIIVRHGLMLVGLSYSGKTSSYRVLQDALKMMHVRDLGQMNVVVTVLAPKAVTLDQLYGYTDEATKDWKDGILAIHFRKLSKLEDQLRKWLIFDGPVDAIWIESMNTVLDDNMKLCLPSGGIIKLGQNMNLIFEVQDLAAASPATVSRCGMVYMEPNSLGWQPLLVSWMNRYLPEPLNVDKAARKVVETLFDWIIQPCLDFVKRQCKEFIRTSDIILMRSALDLFDALVHDMRDEKPTNPYRDMNSKDLIRTVEGLFLFSVVWGIGGCVDEDSRKKFDKFLRNELAGNNRTKQQIEENIPVPYKFNVPFPENDTVYDYMFDKVKKVWVDWMKTVEPTPIADDALYHEILVPTVDTVRYTFLLDTFILHNKHVLFVGPTGTGKTIYIKEKMLKGVNREVFIPIFVNFSARTSANQTQTMIETKLTTRKKGVMGAPVGKRAIIFVDDLNLPAVEQYGAQPPVEFLRQWMDHKGWYDYQSKGGDFISVVDVQFICAMVPPGGGRNAVTPRYTRHFNSVALTQFDDVTLNTIFSTIMTWYLSGTSLISQSKKIAQATVELFNAVQLHCKPTPAKSHYTFNLRDLSKVFQGITMVNKNHLADKDFLLRLWSHEGMRVFSDRLINDADREIFVDIQNKMLQEHFQTSLKNIAPSGNITFANFMDRSTEAYTEVKNMQSLTNIVNDCLTEYNSQNKQQMNLVLFNFAVEHICRISRIITQPYGNALLIGVGGSGRQSLTRLATHIADYRLFQIVMTKQFDQKDWKDMMKELLIMTGIEGKQTVFLFTDNQIKYESFLEDISALLNTGEISNLFDENEFNELSERLRTIARNLNKDQSMQGLKSLFVDRCKAHLHIVLCMSPVGDSLRNYLRMFPSLVNCTTIDWFSEWPADALQSVAQRFTEEIELGDEKLANDCVEVCAFFHRSATQLSANYFTRMKRYNYVTPTTYLELLHTFQQLSKKKRDDLLAQKEKYGTGVNRINETDVQVQNMQKELEILKPALVKLSAENDTLSKRIELESEEANETRKIVEAEEIELNKQNEENKNMEEYCQQQLDRALPALRAAEEAVKELKNESIVEVRSLNNPPLGVKLVMQSVCIIFGKKPVKVDNGMGKKEEDYWEPSKKLMGQKDFLRNIKSFDPQTQIDDDIIAKLNRDVLNKDEYSAEKIKNANVAAQKLRAWVVGLVNYYANHKIVKPRQEALKKALEAAASSAELLQGKKNEMKRLEDRIADLESDRKICEEKKNKLQREYEEVSLKLERAHKLIRLLVGEKSRWEATLEDINHKQISLIGDVLLSAGIISYLGAFTGTFRAEIIEQWKEFLKLKGISFSEKFSLAATCGNAVRIREYVVQELPTDDFSIENAIIVENARRWPLFIDPQGQAINWIRNRENKNLLIIKMSDPNLIKSLESSIPHGTPAIIEGVGEEIDPALEPLLLKQTFRLGGFLNIKLSDNPIPYNEKFRLYMFSSLSNPHYLPEVSTKVTLINFMITPDGLKDQLLGIVVSVEESKLEEQKNNLVMQNAKNQAELAKLENEILRLLVDTPKDKMLDDDQVISALTNSKTASKKVELEQEEARKTEIKIDEKRSLYKPVAENGATLFFCVAEMANVDAMYQYSLRWYKELFTKCINEAKPDNDINTRIFNLIDYFKYSLFTKVCRALFEKDKLLFALVICLKLMDKRGDINQDELRFLVTGGLSVEGGAKNPAPEWLSEKSWFEMGNSAALQPPLSGFRDHFRSHVEQWRLVAESQSQFQAKFPGPFEGITTLQRLIIVRLLRPDKITQAVQQFIATNLDERFIEPPGFNLPVSYADSTNVKPLIFILSPGVDPMENLKRFAELNEKALDAQSLGKGQGPKAIEKIKKAIQGGTWIVLQNCHLAASFMPDLEKLVEDFSESRISPSFRLWLTSKSSSLFPVSVLQRGIKITNEPPKGLKANLKKSWLNDYVNDPTFFGGCKKPREFKKLLFGLCFFHAIVQERRKFGPIGWNIPYEFNESDLRISQQQLQMFLNDTPYIPFKALSYLTGECNYGGRVTDDHDRRTLLAILSDFYNEDILEDGYKFSSPIYYAPVDGDHGSYLTYIDQLPMNQDPTVFGLHDNANITKDSAEGMALFEDYLMTQERGGGSGGGKTMEQIVAEQSRDILAKLPADFNIEEAQKRYPVSLMESMNTVLVQELVRYNALLQIVRSSLFNVQKGIKGEVVMSEQLEKMANSIYLGKIPAMWAAKSYPSLKPLGGYVSDLLKRIEFLQTWLDHGPPPVFWISGFYFTQSFLTGTKQNYARRKKIEIDKIEFEFEVMKDVPKEPPQDGCYVHGLYLEGARWDPKLEQLADQLPKRLFDELPVIWFKPVKVEPGKHHESAEPGYICPVYKTSERKGTLSTTGHSTNYVLSIKLPTDQDEKYWVKRGCALFCQLD